MTARDRLLRVAEQLASANCVQQRALEAHMRNPTPDASKVFDHATALVKSHERYLEHAALDYAIEELAWRRSGVLEGEVDPTVHGLRMSLATLAAVKP